MTSPIVFRDFPPVVTKNELSRLVGKRGDALKVAISRWVKNGVLKKAGPRASVYYNLINDPNWEQHIVEAALKKYPSIIVTGPSVLEAHNSQSLTDGKIWLAVLDEPSLVQFDQVQWVPQNKEWFAQNKPTSELFGAPAFAVDQVHSFKTNAIDPVSPKTPALVRKPAL